MNAVAPDCVAPVAHRIEWQTVERCPACDALLPQGAQLPDRDYAFGDERIDFPAGGIALAHCLTCGLAVKSVLPSVASLSQVMSRQAGKKWMDPYDFREESREVNRLTATAADLLDVGAGSGAFLAALSQQALGGRRSALDVVTLPGCETHVQGEFIHGLIDAKPLCWSGKPYDIVTLFDVAEHLYAPPTAFQNLRELVRVGGLVLIETGNVESEWPQRYGAHHWWYVRLFEHHLFWSRRTLERIARQFGFEMITWRELRHKARGAQPWQRTLTDLAQLGIYRVARRAYPNVATLFGKYWTQPWSPFVRDHFRVVLRKS